jgi:hypothetical protein
MIHNGSQVTTAVHSLTHLQTAVSTQIIGQSTLITRVLVALLADGHPAKARSSRRTVVGVLAVPPGGDGVCYGVRK